jgi:hypothetical protein
MIRSALNEGEEESLRTLRIAEGAEKRVCVLRRGRALG